MKIELLGWSLDVFSAWGDGPDVGINGKPSEAVQKVWKLPELIPFDFTVAEARALAAEINAMADLAEADARAYDASMKEQTK